MNNKFLNTVEKFNMLSYGDRVLAAVSGGADSMAMLNLLLSVKDIYSLSISVAHIEHGIRGNDSVADAEYVKDFCNRKGLPFHLLSINAKKEAKENSMSVEEYSRKRRYEFFYSVPCDKIATAHNLTDNVETVIFRLARGSGLKGMCGIPPVRDKIIRPMIEMTGDEIRNYCAENGIEYRIDKTNFSNDYSRNLIRNEILPVLKQINTGFEASVDSFISSCNEDSSYLESIADTELLNICKDNMLSVEKLKTLSPSVSKRVIKKYFSNNNTYLDSFHLNEVYALVFKGGKIQLKGCVFAVSDKNYLRFACLETKTDITKDTKKDIKIIKKILNIDEFNFKSVDFYCDYDKINGNAVFRHRMSGDTIKPAGRNCTKSLKKLFNELHIPLEERDKTVIVCDDDGVIGVVPYCADERVKADKTTKRIFSITLASED